MENILEVNDLHVSFQTFSGEVHAVRGVSFAVRKGETLAIVGESGSGKSVTSKAIMRLLPTPAAQIKQGEILYQGLDLTKQTEKKMQQIRGADIAMIFQDPMTALDPTMKIGKQITEVICRHQKLGYPEAVQRAIELLTLTGIPQPKERLEHYPHQFSGGMRQRVMIAIALACNPKILIADEPTTALDVTIQAQILELLKEIQQKTQTSIIFITHDLGVVAQMADRVAVMYAGKIVETGQVHEIFYDPRHPYTWGLLGAMPSLERRDGELITIPGSPPDLFHPPRGDAFAPRNQYAMKIDFELEPPMYKITDTHYAATWLLHKKAPVVERPVATRRGEPALSVQKQQGSAQTSKYRKAKLLQVQGLKKHFSNKNQVVKALDGVTFDIYQGETFGLVGESGCGKSTIGRTIMRLYEPTEGAVLYQGEDHAASLNRSENKSRKKRMQMIFQDPYSSLNPRMTVADIIAEGIDIHGITATKQDRLEKVYELLETVGLNREHATRYPHEFSGGQRQRIGIARALAVEPEFIICDEPISALDVSIQAQVVNLLKRLQKEKMLTYLFIAHDLSMVRHISDRIGVMHRGKLVELAPSDVLYEQPLHPYTQSLLSAIPMPDPLYEKERKRIVFDEQAYPSAGEERVFREVAKDHWVACTEAEFELYVKQAVQVQVQ
ncbi:dipeptide ABC transporter ATP-binding protein [Brevibacillus reuszeri]|uniref:ABC transporter ATP-binding protein n=1 Tax=Brevibacillus reuszeri TaxID=54915 RepID=UPI003D1FE263